MFFILILTITSYTTIYLPKTMAQSVGRSSWILILAAGLIFGLAAAVIASLNSRYPGKVMFDYSQEIAGTLGSRLIAVYYLLYFILIGAYLNVRLVNLMSANFLPRTSQNVMLGIAIGLFALVAFRGITNVARLFEIYGIAFLFLTVMLCLAMLTQGMPYNFLPLINPNEVRNFAQGIPRLAFPFGGVEVLLVVPFSKNNKKAARVAFLTLVFIGIFYVLVVESTISILGINNTILYRDAFIEANKIVSLPIIERTDIFYLTVGLMSLFSGLIMMFLAALEFACRLIQKVERPVMALAIGGVYFLLCFFSRSVNNIAEMVDYVSPYLVTVSTILLPATLFALSKIKDKRGSAA